MLNTARLPAQERQSDPKVVIFDLDGTLYNDRAFVDQFALNIARRLPSGRSDDFLADVSRDDRVVIERHFGMIYDREQQRLLGHPAIKPGVVVDWHGRQPDDAWQPVNAEAYIGSRHRFLAIGDQWIRVKASALHYGASVEDCIDAIRILPEMDLPLPEIELHETHFKPFKGLTFVLVTNGRRTHALRMLRYLGLDRVFSLVFADAGKPNGWPRLIAQIQAATGARSDQMISVGDNLINDVLALIELGVKPVLIDRHAFFRHLPAAAWDIAARPQDVLHDLATRLSL